MSVLDLFRMEGKKGFITGAGKGIGRALAAAFAEVGADVAVVDRHADRAEAVAEELRSKHGREIIPVTCDVSQPDQVNGMIRAVTEAYGTLDFAINNAGIVNFHPFEEAPPEEWRRIIDVNLFGLFLTAQAAARAMIAGGKRGSIVNTASMSAHIVNTPQTTSSYCASKAAVVHLTRSMAVEMAKYGIRVNCVSPGYIATEVVTNFSDQVQGWIDRTPQKRMAKPEELAGAYLFLASDASAYATGSELVIDGGYTLV